MSNLTMQTFTSAPARLALFSERGPRLALRSERGAATAEYGVTILVAVALALAVFSLVTGGAFNDVISTLLKAVLSKATGLVGN